MDSFIFSPIFSSIISILLFAGCYQLGKILINKLNLNTIVRSISVLEFQYLAFGSVFLLIVLFPLVAFTFHAKIILQFFGLFLIFLGFYFFYEVSIIVNKYKKIQKKDKDLYFYILLIYIFLYFLLSLSPLTSADVLDYHAGTALNILRLDQYLLSPEWFTGMQSGTGEVLIALGFSVGSEQFGSLIQFSSIITIAGIILNFTKKKNLFSSKYFLILTFLSCPILIFLISGNKPQIFYSSIILISLALNFINYKNDREIFKAYVIINIFICCAVLGKFSFNLIGFIVWIFSTINFYKKLKNHNLLIIPILVFVLIYFPFILWKFENLGGNILTYIINPFPLHLPGYENFLNHNKGSQEIPFPNFLFYTTPSRATEFLAANTLFLIILLLNVKQSKNLIYILIMSFSFVVISNYYASPSARYYTDVIIWITLGMCFLNNIKYNKIIEYIFYPQIIAVLIILIYSCYIFFPGTFSKNNYLKVKNNNAYMFSGMEWVNKNIPDNANVLLINRPLSLYKDFAVSGTFNYFTNREQSVFYKKLIEKYDLEYLIYLGNETDLRHMENCVKGLFKKKMNVGFHATRNPFNKGGSYNAYIFYINNESLRNCY
mgnify:FL=1